METALKKDIYELLERVWSGAAGREFTAELVVPDAMPDAATVVDAEGVLTLRSKDTEAGSVLLAASVSVSVLYAPEGGGALLSVPVTIPAELRIDAPGVDTDCRVTVRMRLRAVEARAVNSRKISVRADVAAEIGAFRKNSMEIAVGLEEDDPSVHILTKTAPLSVVSDVREKTFVVTDEYPLPAGGAAVKS